MKEVKNAGLRGFCPVFCLSLMVLFITGQMFAQEQNINRPGGDYKNFPLTKADPYECEKACRNDIRCKAWTYVKPGVQGPKAHCWLKDSIPLPQWDSNCISGVVRYEINVHGNSGQLQKKNEDAKPLGWGLEYEVAGVGSWIHYSIPTSEAGTVIEAVRIKYSISAPLYGWIRAIHVYDGDKRILTLDNQIYGISLSTNDPVTEDTVFPLLKPVRVTRGVGISIQPETKDAGGLMKIVKMTFRSVGIVVTTNY